MGIFNSNFFSDTTYDVPVAEGLQYDPDFGGAANIAMETYEDMLSVVKAIHVADMIELREGTESVILEGAIGDIFKKIVDGIKNFFSKIAAFFKGLYEKLVLMKKSNKDFATKYKTIIDGELGNYIGTVTVQGYNYDQITEKDGDGAAMEIAKISERFNDGIDILCTTIKDSLNDLNAKVAKNMTDPYNKASDDDKKRMAKPSGALMGYATEVKKAEDAIWTNVAGVIAKTDTAEVFYKKYRGGAESKTSITYNKASLVKALDLLAVLDMKALKNAEKSLTKNMDKIIKTVQDCEKEYKKSDIPPVKNTSVALANKAYNAATQAKSKVLTLCSVYRSCIVDAANQIKTATIKAVSEARDAKKSADKNKKK